MSDKGFTLLEMILVLSVVCVLLLFGGAIVSKNKTAFIYQMKNVLGECFNMAAELHFIPIEENHINVFDQISPVFKE